MHQAIEQILAKHKINPAAFKPPGKFPQVLAVSIPGKDAVDVWFDLRAVFEQTGQWPVLQNPFHGTDRTETLRNVPTGSPKQLLAGRLEARIKDYGDELENVAPDISMEAFSRIIDESGIMTADGKPAREEWPKDSGSKALSLHSITDWGSGKPRARVKLSLITVGKPHEAPAYLGFGGWNDAPYPNLQVAMLREWNKEYGAVPIVIAGDVLECYVERPPQTEGAAFKLAAEQWIFCDDIVSQGTQSIRALAIELWRKPKWFFWWD